MNTNNVFTGTQAQSAGQSMGDKEYVLDSISGQKFMTENYNTFANECVHENLKNDFMNILKDEHQIQYDLFVEAQNRGWYQVEQAQQQKVDQLKQKLSSQ